MIDRMKLARFAREARERTGLTDVEAAARTKCLSYQTIRKLERGAWNALTHHSSIVELAQVYGVDPDEFSRLAGIVPDDIAEEMMREPGTLAEARAWLQQRMR